MFFQLLDFLSSPGIQPDQLSILPVNFDAESGNLKSQLIFSFRSHNFIMSRQTGKERVILSAVTLRR